MSHLAASVRQQLSHLLAQEGFYPEEAIRLRQEGEVWVSLFFDEEGNVLAARLETRSNFPLLDNAALKAARALKSLPTEGLEAITLPVRFRLRNK
jgi:protein TonB